MRASQPLANTPSMDIVAILMGIGMFALLILLVKGIDRI
jgi:hypothetical protein